MNIIINLLAMALVLYCPDADGHPCQEDGTTDNITLTFEPPQNGFVLVQDTVVPFNVTITGVQGNLTIQSIESENEKYFIPVTDDVQRTWTATNGTVFISIPLKGIFVGVANVIIRFDHEVENGDKVIVYEHESAYLVRAGIKPTLLNTLFMYALTSWLVVSYVTMGTAMDIKVILGKFRQPYGIIIGILCQFGIMPILAFALANVIPISPESAIGLLIEGSCPGGWLSNVFALMMDVDFILSITMTFCSSLMALGMMPLNMFLYASPFIGERGQLKTPFKEMCIQLFLMMIPVLIGMYILHKHPKLAKNMSRGLKPVSMGLVFLSLALGIPASSYIFVTSIQVYLVAALLPLIGGTLGFSIARIFRRPNTEAFTIAFETGVQNSLLATVVAKFSYPYPENLLLSRLPLLTATLTIFQGCTVITIYIIYTCLTKGREASSETTGYKPCNEEEANVDELNRSPAVKEYKDIPASPDEKIVTGRDDENPSINPKENENQSTEDRDFLTPNTENDSLSQEKESDV